MKSPLFSVFIVASLMVAIAHCFPGGLLQGDSSEETNKDSLDTVLILPNQRNPFTFSRPLFQVPDFPNFGDDSDDDSLEGFNPFGKNFNFNPFRGSTFDDFIAGMQGVVNRLREQMAGVLSGIPGQGALGLGGKIPEGGNTTSTTKIIDGHLVTINETIYQNDADDADIVYRVHTVVVTPLNQTAGSNDGGDIDMGGGEETETVTPGATDKPIKNDNKKEETTTQDRSVETIEDMTGNSIPDKNEVDHLNA